MTLSSEQAAQTLKDLESVGQRSSQLYRYQRTAPMLWVWGAIWLVGFGLSDVLPEHINLIWPPLDLIGIGACMYLGRSNPQGESHHSGRWLLSIFSILAFYVLVLIVFQPASAQQSASLIALLVALFYVLAGVWVGARFAIAGLVFAALTLVGYFILSAHFDLWMALVGGGALGLAGFWLRRA